jgi:hypothetical protein
MPNTIWNCTLFTGPAAALQTIRESNMNFQKILPCPYIPSDGSKPVNDDWYDWCCVHWGTKWSAWDPVFQEVDGGLQVRYRTAWDPPHGLLSHLTQQFPDLKIENRYIEEFHERYGFTMYESGVITDQHLLPDQFSGSALRDFAATVDWFDYESYSSFVGGVLDGDRTASPVRLTQTHLTRDEFLIHFA